MAVRPYNDSETETIMKLHTLTMPTLGLSALALCLLCAGLSPAAQAKEITTLRIGVEGAYPPFSETAPDGSLFGLDIDVANAVCAEMKVQCKLVKQEWDGMIPALQARKFDAIVASMAITEERKQKVAFTHRYYSTPQRLLAPRGSTVKEVSAAGLKGRRIGVQRGTNSESYASRFWEPSGVQVVRYGRQDEVYLDLVAGRLDGAFTDGLEAEEGFLKRPEGQKFQFIGEPIYGRTAEEKAIIGEGAGIAVRKSDHALRARLDQALDNLRRNGTWERIRSKYFAHEIYSAN